MLVTIILKESKAMLINIPKITSEPKNIIDVISLDKIKKESNNQKHVWKISLLNHGESIILDYNIYSKEKIDKITISILTRKKDWIVTNKSLFSNNDSIFNSGIDYILVLLAAPIPLILSIFLLALPLYGVSWLTRKEYHEFYNTFNDFYWGFPPKYLFKSKEITIKYFDHITTSKENSSGPKKIQEEEP